MRIVITGATSFVGAAAIQELLENGHEVYAVVRPSSKKLETLTEQMYYVLLSLRAERHGYGVRGVCTLWKTTFPPRSF